MPHSLFKAYSGIWAYYSQDGSLTISWSGRLASRRYLRASASKNLSNYQALVLTIAFYH